MKEESKEKNIQDLAKFVKENYWKVRDCADYKEEYIECNSWKGRFQQKFLYGEKLDCSKWKEDMKNCGKPEDDYEAYASIIRHENERLEKRIKAQVGNTVWTKRTEPPSNWNSELPDFVHKRQEEAYKTLDSSGSCIIS